MNGVESMQGLAYLLQAVVVLTPLGILIWRMACVAHAVKKAERDIALMKDKLREWERVSNTEWRNVTEEVRAVQTSMVELLANFKAIQRELEEFKTDVKAVMQKG